MYDSNKMFGFVEFFVSPISIRRPMFERSFLVHGSSEKFQLTCMYAERLCFWTTERAYFPVLLVNMGKRHCMELGSADTKSESFSLFCF